MEKIIDVKVAVKEIAKGRKEFTLSTAEYRALSIEVQKELDKNFWRFPAFSKGYVFEEMDDDAKAHFANEEMVIHHSTFAF